MTHERIELGDEVKDIYTGFRGIAVSRCQFLYGCDRICIEPTKPKDGKPDGGVYFDEQRVVLVKRGNPAVSPNSKTTKTGGPQQDPTRNREP